ncbi:hypothetical protein N7468_009758 [Penicillium chermesinum]|uniref:Peptidase M24 domain-containing protein n=1 Tax=Penicillium chermesinum TaxID=63820 RepID=A0A9W9NKT9_9EURO|nr:uncharacterized protein N7468_009758 [Penicillium chermesinum]KAJ5220554.1 hypothetical protein N7468_009758 [Penicillium chermesinum]KAJ6157980.1 hypothetical protein N7470_005572 [Penicillium chermesinum]
MADAEAERASKLLEAQVKAYEFFDEIDKIVRPGVSEKTLSEEIYQIGLDRFGIKTHWHKREDDILIVDLGPVLEKYEADIGRTYVIGNDPHKIKLRDSLQPIWDTVKAKFDEKPDMTGHELYTIARAEAKERGYDFGADIAGHIVGSFPHERIPQDRIQLYITEGNHGAMVQPGKDGLKRHWILEIHLRDTERGYQGFVEQLLTVPVA